MKRLAHLKSHMFFSMHLCIACPYSVLNTLTLLSGSGMDANSRRYLLSALYSIQSSSFVRQLSYFHSIMVVLNNEYFLIPYFACTICFQLHELD